VPKEIRIVLSDLEYQLLRAIKGSKTWKELLLESASLESKNEK